MPNKLHKLVDEQFNIHSRTLIKLTRDYVR